MTDRYAVVGNPVAHSKSPQIHAEFARQTGQDLEYGRLLAPLDGFVATVQAFRAEGGRGVNVTVPFKLDAYALAEVKSVRALEAEAVNTLKFEAAAVYGDNTDGVGLVRDLEANLCFALHGRRILLVGAGGAAQGVIGPLLDARPESLVVGNRTVEKAQRLVARFHARRQDLSRRLRAESFAGLRGESFDLVVNATSASLDDAMPELPGGLYASGSLAYDMMYGKGLTPFLQQAEAGGAARLADGLGMLVEQAAESFFIWRGVRPQTPAVIEQLKRA